MLTHFQMICAKMKKNLKSSWNIVRIKYIEQCINKDGNKASHLFRKFVQNAQTGKVVVVTKKIFMCEDCCKNLIDTIVYEIGEKRK